MPPNPHSEQDLGGQLPDRERSLLSIHSTENTSRSTWEKGKRTHSDLGALGFLPVKAEHDDLQAVAAVGALEEAGLDEVVGAAGGEVDPPVRQAVAVQEKNVRQVKEKPLPSSNGFAFCSSSSLGMLSRQAGSVFSASSVDLL